MRKFYNQLCFWLVLMLFLAVISTPADITKGMIGYWPLDGNAKDESGNEYHGELTKGVKWEANGKVGGAAEFDGQGGHIKVAEHLAPEVVNFTVVTWINGYKVNNWAAFVSARGNGAQSYWMGYHDQTDTLTYVWNHDNAQTWNWQESVKIPRDTWGFAIAIEKKKATAYAYTVASEKLEMAENKIDHVLQAPLNFVFGRDSGTRCYKGLLDEIMMFERTLNKAEIMQLATIGLNVEAKNKLATSWGTVKQSHITN